MNSEDHPLIQLTDYSLGLLPREERTNVDRHLRHCVRCREIVQQDQALALEIRHGLLAATRPSPTRLRQLAPSPRRGVQRRLVTLLRPALALAIVLLLFVAGLSANGEIVAPVTPHATATTLAVDVADGAALQAAIERVASDLGRLDILVNNAGITRDGLALRMSDEEFDAVMNVNLRGAFLCTKHAGRAMLEQGRGGRIINIASQAAKSGVPHAGAYCASKHGVVGLTRVAAIEFGEAGFDPRRALCFTGERHQLRRPPAGHRCLRPGADPRIDDLLDDGIPVAAALAAPDPARGDRPAGLADEGGFCARHVVSPACPEDNGAAARHQERKVNAFPRGGLGTRQSLRRAPRSRI